MPKLDLDSKLRALQKGSIGTANRIRRYSLDKRLQQTTSTEEEKALWRPIVERLNVAWQKWLDLRMELVALTKEPTIEGCDLTTTHWLELDREVDLIQRELISAESGTWGVRTIVALSITLLISGYIYLATHGMAWLDASEFEPWPDWGPAKYFEVAAWGFFGVLCSLLSLAAYHVARRDFDLNYVTWYLSTAVRAPVLVVILMMIVLEFVEWYGEDTWIQNYILEEGNKFFFIVFMSFCLGIASDTTANTIGELTHGVGVFVRNAVRAVARRLGAVVSDADILGPS